MNGWTPERRARQAELIQRWKPWKRATGPKTEEGKARVAQNGWKGAEREVLRELARMVRRELKQAQELSQRCGK